MPQGNSITFPISFFIHMTHSTTKTAYKASFSPLLISKKSVAGPTPQGFGCQILLQCASSRSRQAQRCQCASIEPSRQQTA